MKNRRRLVLKSCAAALCLLTLSGCWSGKEVDMLSVLMGIGVDKSETPGQLDVTAQIVVPNAIGSPTKASPGDQKAYFNATQTGDSVIGALRDLTHRVSRKLYVAHTQVLIVGKAQAQVDMQECLDLFIRDHEARLSVQLLIADGKASDIMKSDLNMEKIPSVNLEKLMTVQFATSTTAPMHILDFINAQMSESNACVVPLVGMKTNPEENTHVSDIIGLAIFNKGIMVGQILGSAARGCIYVTDQIKSGMLDVEVPGGSAQIEILKSKTSRSVKVGKDKKIALELSVQMQAGLAGKITRRDLTAEKMIKLLEKETEDLVKKEIKEAFAYSQEIQTDFFGVGNQVYKKKPKLWNELKKDWENHYPDVELKIKVRVKLLGSGRLSKPVK